MSELKVWATSEDGTIEYVALTKERLAEAMDLMKKYFFPYENICRAAGLADNPEAIEELLCVPAFLAKTGVSVVAIDKETGNMAGVLINQLREKNIPTPDKAKDNLKNSKFPEVLNLLEISKNISQGIDLFSSCNVDCEMDLVQLVVSPKYSKRGIGLKLCEVSIELATLLFKGKNVKTPLDDNQLPLEPRPKIVSSLFTTFKTQKIGRKLKFDILKTINYEELFLNGKSLASILGTETKGFTSEYKVLE